jgi:hypothetical protein
MQQFVLSNEDLVQRPKTVVIRPTIEARLGCPWRM